MDSHTTLAISSDGQVTMCLDPAYDAQVLVGVLHHLEGRTAFVAETADGRDAPDARRLPVDVAVKAGQLRMGLPDEPATVYARK